ncbi:MAG TPA: acyltransferase family protein [Nocardioides sp.]|nr:acyltransferase family protein [Nocardioides sp.]
MRPTKNGFRPDIQGLRAIAVGAVVLCHLQLGILAGGYVGVDVFFAISGFLITGLMLREVDTTGRLSLTGFYARRARRILPAASLVLLATAAASALWLGPVLAPATFVSIVWAALFLANAWFAHLDTDYFSADLPPSPVQHYWSLSVEEQFYVVWPLLVVLVLLVTRRRAPRAVLAGVLGVIAVVSLAWSVHLTRVEPSAAYFSSLTRAWELAAGALAAVAVAAWRHRDRTAPRWAVEAVGVLGAVAIVVACLAFDDGTAFPGYAAALPVLGTVAVLVAGGLGAPTSWIQRLLAVRPLQLIGDWSYSIYLWHWPLLIIPALHVGRPLRPAEKIAILVLTLVLSGLTVRLVERPFRTHRRLTAFPRRALAFYPLTAALVMSSAFGARAYVEHASNGGDGAAITLPRDWKKEYGVDDPAVALVRASARATRQGDDVPHDLRPKLTRLRDSTADIHGCDYRDESFRELCPRGDEDGDRTLVLLGDSHARHWIPALEKAASEAGYRAYFLAKPQCVPALVTTMRVANGEPFRECDDFKGWALDQVAELQPDLVVVSTSPGSKRGVYERGELVTDLDRADQLVERGMVRLLQRLDENAGRTALLADIPNVSGDPGRCLARGRPTLRACSFPEQATHAQSVDLQLRAAERAGVEAIPTRQWFCDGRICPPVIGRTIPYRDGGHMTADYSATLADSLGRRLGMLR